MLNINQSVTFQRKKMLNRVKFILATTSLHIEGLGQVAYMKDENMHTYMSVKEKLNGSNIFVFRFSQEVNFEDNKNFSSLLQLLFGTQVVTVPTFPFAAIRRTGMKTSVALATNHFLTVVFHSQSFQSRFNDATTQSQNKVQG